MQSQKRIGWIDIAKAIAIFLVVFGHTLRSGYAQKIVYSFHVALFFLLSGMTCKADNINLRIKNDVFRILIPYYSFGIISALIFTVLGKFAASQFKIDINTSFLNSLGELLYACPKNNRLKFNMPLWFLPCLFATKMFYYALYKVYRGKYISVLISSFALAALGFVYTRFNGPDLPFNIHVSLKMLFFFTLGRCFFLWVPTFKNRYFAGNKAIVLGIILLIMTIGVAWFAPKVDYSGDDFPSIGAFVLSALMGSCGICFISMGIDNCTTLEYVGKRSLAILVMHKFPVLLFQTIGPLKTPLMQYNSAIGILSAVVVSLIAIVLSLVAEWIIRRFFPFLLGDLSSILPHRP